MNLNGNSVWLKILGVIVPLIAAATVALVTMRADVRNLQTVVETKASREVVTEQYQSLLRELQAIRTDLTELKRRRP